MTHSCFTDVPDSPHDACVPISRVWPHVRAALVTAHLAIIALAAVPAPEGGMDRNAWRDPTVQTEFARWSKWFGTTPERFEDRLYALATAYMNARAHVMRPIAPYLDLTGAQQPWRLFVAPHRFPARLQIQTHRRGAFGNVWDTLFEERSATARWHANFFESERVRTAIFRYSWPAFAGDARQFCRYVARTAFTERPGDDVVRCRFYKAPSPSPDEVREGRIPEGEWVQETRVSKRDLEGTP